MTSRLERERIAAVRPDAQLLEISALGFYELVGSGISRDEVFLELVSRAASSMGVKEAHVDFEFPLGVAERLRADGISITVDDAPVKARRRSKSEAELDGIVRAQRAAESAMAAATKLLRAAQAAGEQLQLDGKPLLAETIRDAMREECWRRGTLLPSEVIVASVWQGFGHESGSGPLPAGLPIQIDLWPHDERSACWADMTRTFVVGGEPSEEVLRQEALVTEALTFVRAAIKPGITGAELHGLCCDVFEREGYTTQRTGPGEDQAEGFQFSLGHGVGLQVHEDPGLGIAGRSPLVAGDVLALEPGLWQRDVGGVRFEDLVLVTDDGCETLTDYPYELTP
jgi:Xaa-Pro aminopeptidase